MTDLWLGSAMSSFIGVFITLYAYPAVPTFRAGSFPTVALYPRRAAFETTAPDPEAELMTAVGQLGRTAAGCSFERLPRRTDGVTQRALRRVEVRGGSRRGLVVVGVDLH